MKFFQKTPVAVAVMLLAILLSIGIGYAKGPGTGLSSGLDAGLDTSYYEQFIYDQADVLSSSAEKTLAGYLANWDLRYNSVVAFASVDSTSNSEEYAYDLSESFQLGSGDALLLIVDASDEYQFVWGDEFDSIMTVKATDQLAGTLESGSWQSCVLDFYAALNDIYVTNFGEGNAALDNGVQNAPQPVPQPVPQPSPARSSAGSWAIVLIVLIVAVVAMVSAIDRSRYNTYRRQYYGVANPPVMFRPILFWHGPRSSWYRRRWAPPPPPPPPGPRGPGIPPRGPGGIGGVGGTPPRPSSGGARPSGGSATGFGGIGNRGPRGTGFGGSSGGGSFGGTRGGSFGGSRPSGGGFSGGSRGGGSFGGRR